MEEAGHAQRLCRKETDLGCTDLGCAREVDHTSGAQDSPWESFTCKWSLRCGVDEITWRVETRNTTLGNV